MNYTKAVLKLFRTTVLSYLPVTMYVDHLGHGSAWLKSVASDNEAIFHDAGTFALTQNFTILYLK